MFSPPFLPLSERALRAHREVVARGEAEKAHRVRRRKADARSRWIMLLGEHNVEDWHEIPGSPDVKITLDGMTLVDHSAWRSGGGYLYSLRLTTDPEKRDILTLAQLGAALDRARNQVVFRNNSYNKGTL